MSWRSMLFIQFMVVVGRESPTGCHVVVEVVGGGVGMVDSGLRKGLGEG